MKTGDIALSQRKILSRSDSRAYNVRILRRSAASALIFGGLAVASTAKRLGHSRTSTTLDVYAHLIQDAEQKSADILGEAFLKHA